MNTTDQAALDAATRKIAASTPVRIHPPDPDMRYQLKLWEQQALIDSRWELTWDQKDGCHHARFKVCGVGARYDLPEAEFELFARGFNDRRTALMARRPQARR